MTLSDNKSEHEKHVLTKKSRDELRPQDVIQMLQDGNQRFVDNKLIDWDYRHEQEDTSGAQYPAAIVLGCIDSRVPAEILFNLRIGDIFNISFIQYYHHIDRHLIQESHQLSFRY